MMNIQATVEKLQQITGSPKRWGAYQMRDKAEKRLQRLCDRAGIDPVYDCDSDEE